jgi:hypothetical protein
LRASSVSSIRQAKLALHLFQRVGALLAASQRLEGLLGKVDVLQIVDMLLEGLAHESEAVRPVRFASAIRRSLSSSGSLTAVCLLMHHPIG